jgi:hypothetical protein
MQQWTLQAFWTSPWTKSDIILAFSSGVTICAILVALSLAVWEHKRADLADRQNKRRFVEEVVKLMRGAITACDQCLEALANPQPTSDPEALVAACNSLLTSFGDSMDVLRPLAPADGKLTVATTQTRQLLEPISEDAVRLQSAWDAVSLRAQRMRAALNRLLQLR